MVDGFWGADTELVAEHSRRMQARAAELLALRAALDVVVRQEQIWQGPDAESFRAQWTGGVCAELQRAAERLGALGQEARAHGLEQEVASAAEGSAFAGAGAGTVSALPASWKDLRSDSSVDPSDVSGDYDYDKHYDFDLGEDGPRYSGEMLWKIALANFSDVFPIPGMPDNPQVGDQFDLMFNPVEVVDVGERSLTLKSLPGHIEGEGNLITFTISEDGTSFDVEARGPDATWFPNVLPDIFWPMFADNLADLHQVDVLAPGPMPYVRSVPEEVLV